MNLATFRLYLLLNVGLLFVGLSPALAQSEEGGGSGAAAASTCLFSCPESDASSWPLVKRPHTIGWESYYSIFECVYSIPKTNPSQELHEHKCSYGKQSGIQRLRVANDNCPPRAIQCPQPRLYDPEDDEGEDHVEPPLNKPKFSNLDAEEVPPWVDNGRYLLFLSEHHPS
ncbi:hypothetical protein CPB84DRAFT_379267 [Gymnopilus junonius]|uniref:Uncharacterized protein n=1 Tax=Gymnopilus junonius TaxID=109634 RepID=A0A9P5TH50_GYMJU|nr:hypothetical protein CPB84DRAFT_379267 [Gymnopilus junonius]